MLFQNVSRNTGIQGTRIETKITTIFPRNFAWIFARNYRETFLHFPFNPTRGALSRHGFKGKWPYQVKNTEGLRWTLELWPRTPFPASIINTGSTLMLDALGKYYLLYFVVEKYTEKLVCKLELRIWVQIRIHRIHMFLGLLDPDPDPLVRGLDPDPSITK